MRSNCVFQTVLRRVWACAIRKFRRRNLPRWRSQTILSYWDAGRCVLNCECCTGHSDTSWCWQDSVKQECSWALNLTLHCQE